MTVEIDGTYDVEKCRRQLAENTTAAKQRKPVAQPTPRAPIAADPDSEVTTLAEAERQLKWEGVRKQKFENDLREGNLAPVGEINAWIAGMILRAREVFLRIGPELKDRLSQETNPHQCERLVMREITRALGELSEFKPVASNE